MHNLHLGANLHTGAKLHLEVNLHPLMYCLYINKLCSLYVIEFALKTYHKCFSFTFRRIQLALRMFKIPSCEKNASFALFIYTIFKKDKCHL